MKYLIKPQSFVIPIVGGVVAWYFSNNASVGVAAFAILLMPVWIRIYMAYAKDNPQQLWFKRKLYGWGWVPVSWQGWLVTIGYIGITVALANTIDDHSPTREVAFMFVLPFAILTVMFIRIAYKRGEKPRWQWGDDGK